MGMTNRRSSRRLPFRKRIRYGFSNPNFLGYTTNISEKGIRIESNKILAPRSKISIQIFMGEIGLQEGAMEEVVMLEGEVVWVTPTLQGFLPSMGVKLISRADEIKSIYKQKIDQYKN